MPRRQQRGAGLFDAFSSDPSKKKEVNLKKIEELKKESETKCEEIKKLNAVKIEKLNAENVALEEKKNAKPETSWYSGLFTENKDKAATNDPAVVTGNNDSGFFSGLFSGPDVNKAAGPDVNKAAGPDVNTAAGTDGNKAASDVVNPLVKNLGGREQKGGKKRKSQRRRKSKARKSAKK